MNVTKSGLLVGFVIGSVIISGLLGYVLYSKINVLEDQIEELEQTYIETGFTEFEREILFYYLKGYGISIFYSNYTLGMSETLSYINHPELHTNYNITLHDISKLELRDLMFQSITLPRLRVIYGVCACSSEEILYAYEVEPWNETANMNKLNIYIWSPRNSN